MIIRYLQGHSKEIRLQFSQSFLWQEAPFFHCEIAVLQTYFLVDNEEYYIEGRGKKNVAVPLSSKIVHADFF